LAHRPHRARARVDEAELVAGLRRRDEAAFVAVVTAYHQTLLRIARLHVSSMSVAEEVVQETWLAVMKGIDRFDGRSSLKTWCVRILVNHAVSRGRREGRIVPFSALAAADASPAGSPSVSADRFHDFDHPVAPYLWSTPPRDWPEDSLLVSEVRQLVADKVAALPAAQRTVISLRDIEGWAASETCDALGISDANQRVLLHRARATIRSALEGYLTEESR
jgi:RNA polymerase sigma-70 factor, ECF subfamily